MSNGKVAQRQSGAIALAGFAQVVGSSPTFPTTSKEIYGR